MLSAGQRLDADTAAFASGCRRSISRSGDLRWNPKSKLGDLRKIASHPDSCFEFCKMISMDAYADVVR